MSVESLGTNSARGVDEPGPAASNSTLGFWSRLSRLVWRLVQSLGAMGGALSLIWAAYTYSDQSTQQRRQQLLSAFDLVDGHLGTATAEKIQKAISPFYSIGDATTEYLPDAVVGGMGITRFGVAQQTAFAHADGGYSRPGLVVRYVLCVHGRA